MKCKLELFVHRRDGTVGWIPEPKPGTYTSDEEATSKGRWWVACNPGVVTAFKYIWLEEDGN